ncbi:MAG: DNA replication and repair protein RecF, partial [Candidatus Cloacimonadota bacterium]|nr:DNA replication and repair protein RecF [Candidatus Cloacimonadota bacterium]
MRILSLRIKNFRNFGDFEINFEKVGALLFGPNGLGKTNLLEAISYFSYGKSFRSISDKNCIKFDEEIAQLNSEFLVNNNFIKFDIAIDQKNKVVRIQDKKINRLSELYSLVKIVYFSPDDTQIISGSPKLRRRFFDIAISQYNYNYLNLLTKYSRLLKQRNAFLKNSVFNQEEKDIWDIEFAKVANNIIKIRLDYLNKF